MLPIHSYQIGEKLLDSVNSVVHRGKSIQNGESVILKFLRPAYPTPEKVGWFKHEFDLTYYVSSFVEGVVKPYGLEQTGHQWVMALEDFGGDSLSRLKVAGKMDVGVFLSLAIRIVDILGQVHQLGVIHKDINPANIIFNPATGQIKLADFSISTRLPREILSFCNPETLEGTPAYISPEQTGRMNRAIDYRTDFYSLGATFYELLTGQLPFPTENILELTHHHIARELLPPTALNSQIPLAFDSLLNKLMAKNAEDRYSSAAGLKADLEKCLIQWESSETIEPFPLGQQDFPDRLQIPQKLYGREQEITSLLDAFEQVSQGHNALFLISGYSGIGKTSLVQEIFKPLTRQQGYFLSGKFEYFQRNIPYSAFIHAIRGLIRQILTESEDRISRWRGLLSDALGNYGEVIRSVVPELEMIIGPQSPVPELSPVEAQIRFGLIIKKFLSVFASVEHPLALFLDDLQWSDSASLSLLHHLMSGSGSPYLLLIGAYRDNEVNDAHPLMIKLRELEKEEIQFQTLTLAPLLLSNLTEWLADTLSNPPQQVIPLAELIHTKTGGNPFFAEQFLHTLYAENLLSSAFSGSGGKWRWNVQQIMAKDLTENVVEFLANEVSHLSPETQDTLKIAACIGKTFDLRTLAILCEQPTYEVAISLWPALSSGTILPLSESYRLANLQIDGLETIEIGYTFAHDRVHQAVSSILSDETRQETHLRIGRLMLNDFTTDRQESRIFDLVNHLNLGCRLISSETEQEYLAELNLLAGKHAKASGAFQPALVYFITGLNLLNRDPLESQPDPLGEGWTHRYDLTLTLCEEAAEQAFLTKQYALMEKLIAAILKMACSQLEKIRAYELQIQAYHRRTRFQDVLQTALPLLEDLGVSFPDQPNETHVADAFEQNRLAFHNKSIKKLSNLPRMHSPELLAAMHILARIGPTTFVLDKNLYTLSRLKMVELSIQHGNSPASVSAYASYGLLLCTTGEIEMGYRFGKLALELVDKLNAWQFKTRTLHQFEVFIRPWKEPLRASLPSLLTAYQSGLETGDLEFAAYCSALYCWYTLFAGVELTEVNQVMQTYREIYYRQKSIQVSTEIYWQGAFNLMGNTASPLLLQGPHFNEEIISLAQLAIKNPLAVHTFHLTKSILHYLFEDYPMAFDHMVRARKYESTSLGSYGMAILAFYDSLIRLSLYSNQSPHEQTNHLKQIAFNQKQLKTWSKYAPENFSHKWHLVEAERGRVQGQHADAREHYDLAISQAREQRFLHEEALANELAARHAVERGQEHLGSHYIREAHYAYLCWGAMAKVQSLENHFPQFLLQKDIPTSETITTPYSTPEQKIATTLDLTSILQAAQALSGEIELDQLLVKLMQIVIANAGAQKGYLLLEHNGAWFIEAESDVEQPEVNLLQSLPASDSLLPLSLIQFVTRTQETIVLENAVDDSYFIRDPYILSNTSLSILCLPLLHQGALIGILYLENNLVSGAFTPDRLETLRLLSGQAAISLVNARLYAQLEEANRTLDQRVKERTRELHAANARLKQLANYDQLTGVYNRHHFFERAANEQKRAHRYHRPFSILLFDLDHFKNINDTFGHAAGDFALQKTAQRVGNIQRKIDIFARFGGEEFVLLLPETETEGALAIAERVREAISMPPIIYENAELPVTASIGVATWSGSEDSLSQLLNRADQAMYAAKAAGKNCVQFAEKSQ